MDDDAPKLGFTKTPNLRYDSWARQMTTAAEIKCVDAIIRDTFGWHRNETLGLTIPEFEAITGLSRPSVIKGLKLARRHGIAERIQVPIEPRGHTYAYRLIMRPEFKLLEPAVDAGLQCVLPFDVYPFSQTASKADEVKNLNSVKSPTKLKVLTPSRPQAVKSLNSVGASPLLDKESKTKRKKKGTHRSRRSPVEKSPATTAASPRVRVGFVYLSRFKKQLIIRYAWASHNFTADVNDYLKSGGFAEDGMTIRKASKADQLRGIINPVGWATVAHRTGEHDDEIQKWIDDPTIFDFKKWRYGT